MPFAVLKQCEEGWYICGKKFSDFCKSGIKTFNLNTFNGIEKVTIKPDHSQHYQSYLDEGPVYMSVTISKNQLIFNKLYDSMEKRGRM